MTTIENTLRTTTSLIPAKKLAVIIGTHYQTLYGYVRDGSIPYIRCGARLKFDGNAVADWLERRTVAAR